MKNLSENDAVTPDPSGTKTHRRAGNSRSPSPLPPQDGDASTAEKPPSPAIAYRIKTPGQVLHDAIGRRDLDAVARILEASPACIDARNGRGRTPLHIVSQFGPNTIVKLLISKGADINARSRWGYTPLSFAADSVRPRIMVTLLGAKAQIEAATRDDLTPLHLAAVKKEKNTQNSILILLIRGANPNAVSKKGLTPLQSAVSEGRVENVQILCAFGADPTFKNPEGHNAFHYTGTLKYKSLGAQVESMLSKWQVTGKQTRRLLPELSAFITEEGEVDVSAMLCWASEKGHLSLVQCILEIFGEDNPSLIESRAKRGWKPIHHAAWGGESKVAEILLKHGADVNAKTLRQNCTPLHLAAMRGRQRAVRTLLEHGADILAEDDSGGKRSTAFQLAADGGHPKTLEVLRLCALQITDHDRQQTALSHYAKHLEQINGQGAGNKSAQDTGDVTTPDEVPSKGNNSTEIHIDSDDSDVESAESRPSALPGTNMPATGSGSFDDGTLSSVSPTSLFLSHSEGYQKLLRVWGNFDFKKKHDTPVRVAVLDTGLDVSHPHFKNPRLKNFERGKPIWAVPPEPSQYDRIKDCEDFTGAGPIISKDKMIDLDGHGTKVAELILRLAPRSELYIARICEGDVDHGTDTPSGPTANPVKRPRPDIAAKAIDWALEQKVDIINMSFGFTNRHRELMSALRRAASDKVLVFAAMSNGGNDSLAAAWPAKDQFLTIGVHSCQKGGKRTSDFTPMPVGASHNFMFVGEQVITQWPQAKGGGFGQNEGTSFATPAVAAMAALILGFARQHACKREREKAKGKIELDELRTLSGMQRVLDRISLKDETGKYSYIHPSLLWMDFDTSLADDRDKVRQHAWDVIVQSLR